MPGDWTDGENDACVAAYLDLLEAELGGRRLVKSEVNRKVQDVTGRSRGSVEYKFQNVSAVLQALRHPWVEGYKPAMNYQDSLREAVLRALPARSSLAEAAYRSFRSGAPDEPTRDFHFDLSEAPRPERPRRDVHWVTGAIRLDYVALDALNRSLGQSGELAVVEHERRHLHSIGRGDLASRVEHVSSTRGDGLGFDVLSFSPAGEERLIEVKTTRRGRYWPMLVTRNEVAVSRVEHDRFEVHRLFDFTSHGTKAYVLKGAIDDACDLLPVTYEALPKAVGQN